MPLQKFHNKSGKLVKISTNQTEAFRLDASTEFSDGIVFSGQPLELNEVFTIKITETVVAWKGSIEIGLISRDPEDIVVSDSMASLGVEMWWISASTVFQHHHEVKEDYCQHLDSLKVGDTVGIMLNSNLEMHLFINGMDQGCAVRCGNIQPWAVVDIYGMCSGISIVQNEAFNELMGAEGGDSLIQDSTIGLGLQNFTVENESLKFHKKCGSLIRFENENMTAFRTQPEDEFNNGVVMTNRGLRDDEMFEIRINELMQKWSGSIEIGVTSHDPDTLDVPSTMTTLRSGTWMYSGCGILINGKATRKQYTFFHLDQLKLNDHIGVMRTSKGALHFFINGVDQGVAATDLPSKVYGVVDIYGRAVNVSVVQRNKIADRDIRNKTIAAYVNAEEGLFRDFGPIEFHSSKHGNHVKVNPDFYTAQRTNPIEDFNNAVLFTSCSLNSNEKMTIKIDKLEDKWAGSVEIGVSSIYPETVSVFPATATNFKTRNTWILTAAGIVHNGETVIEDYGVNALASLKVGDTVSVMRKPNGDLYFYCNDVNLGLAAINVPDKVYGVVDLYGQASKVTLVHHNFKEFDLPKDSIARDCCMTTECDDQYYYDGPYFARISEFVAEDSECAFTRYRKNALMIYDQSMFYVNRALRVPNEFVELSIDSVISHWTGSIEIGAMVADDESRLNLHGRSIMSQLDIFEFAWAGRTIVNKDQQIQLPYSSENFGEGTIIKVKRLGVYKMEILINDISICKNIKVTERPLIIVVNMYGKCAQVTLLPYTEDFVPETIPRKPQTNDKSGKITFDIPSDCGKVVQTTVENNINNKKFEIQILKVDKTTDDYGRVELGYIALKKDNKPREIVFPVSDGYQYEKKQYYLAENYKKQEYRLLKLMRSNTHCRSSKLNQLRQGDVISLFYSNHSNTFSWFLNGVEIKKLVTIFPSLDHGLDIVLLVGFKGRIKKITTQEYVDIQETNENYVYGGLIPFIPLGAGRNVRVYNFLRAVRVTGYDQGFVKGFKPLANDSFFIIEVKHLSDKWKSSLVIGIAPPDCTSNYKSFDSIYVSGNAEYCGNVKTYENNKGYGFDLNNLKVGQTVGILVQQGSMNLYIDNLKYTLFNRFKYGYHPFIDLNGNCEEVELLIDVNRIQWNWDNSKWMLGDQSSKCPGTSVCESFIKSCKLPKQYVNMKLMRCFCESCWGEITEKEQGNPTLRYSLPTGWCRYEINPHPNVDFANILRNWNVAYMATDIASIRKILDCGEVPVDSNCNVYDMLAVSQNNNKNRVMVSPNVSTAMRNHDSTDNVFTEVWGKYRGVKFQIECAFQVLLKPGTFKMSSTTENTSGKETQHREWYVTKHGTTVLSHVCIKATQLTEKQEDFTHGSNILQFSS